MGNPTFIGAGFTGFQIHVNTGWIFSFILDLVTNIFKGGSFDQLLSSYLQVEIDKLLTANLPESYGSSAEAYKNAVVKTMASTSTRVETGEFLAKIYLGFVGLENSVDSLRTNISALKTQLSAQKYRKGEVGRLACDESLKPSALPVGEACAAPNSSMWKKVEYFKAICDVKGNWKIVSLGPPTVQACPIECNASLRPAIRVPAACPNSDDKKAVQNFTVECNKKNGAWVQTATNFESYLCPAVRRSMPAYRKSYRVDE
jgi:hypothetical protein